MLSSILGRLVRIFKRDIGVFREIRYDPKATLEAALIVVAVSLVSALGAAFGSGSFGATLVIRFFAGILVQWFLWSYVIVFVLANLRGIDTEFWQVARLMGYASIPMAVSILHIIGCLDWVITSLAWLLTLVLAFFMIRDSHELTTERTLIALGSGWAAVLLIDIALSLVFRIG